MAALVTAAAGQGEKANEPIEKTNETATARGIFPILPGAGSEMAKMVPLGVPENTGNQV
jgi:hypothetical protein